jgi:glycerophosphoryl diester phosphodiesterase
MGATWRTLDGLPTRVIAHRGASGYLPEHTAAAFRLGIEQGADAIEPDVVPSRDGVLVVRHDRGLAHSTDVASRPEFADRARRLPDGSRDWHVDDFDWAELCVLRAVQPQPGRSTAHDGRHALISLAELLDLAAEAGAARGRPVAVYPELKDPVRFAEAGLDLVGETIALLARHPARALVPGVLSFDLAPLAGVRQACGVEVVAELEYEDALLLGDGPFAWESLASRFAGISVDKRALLGDAEGAMRVELAHRHGLAVYAWTFRDDRPGPGFAGAAAEYEAAFALGLDFVFSDFPDSALAARARFGG